MSEIKWRYAPSGGAELYRLPSRKDPPRNDWAERNGLEVDLSSPLWESFSISLEVQVPSGELQAFYDELYRGEVQVPLPLHPDRKLRLRYSSLSELIYRRQWHTLALQMENDLPLQLLDGVTEPALSSGWDCDLLEVEGIMLEHVDSNLYAPAPLKKPWLYESDHSSERVLLSSNHKRGAGSFYLQCVTLARLGNLKALWQKLASPKPLVIADKACYYSSMSELSLVGHYLRFTLNFQMI